MQVIHIAGPAIQIETHLRQRCAWCGDELIDYELTLVAVPEEQDPRPATWEQGSLVAVDRNASWVVEYEQGTPLPEGICAAPSDASELTKHATAKS